LRAETSDRRFPLDTTAAWHTLAAAEVARRLQTDPQRGLSAAQAEERLRTCGPNQLERTRGPSAVLMFLRQLAEPLMLLLIAAAAVSAFVTHELTDSAVIGVIVLLSALLGFSQERRAHRALEALRAMAEPSARVVRESQPREIPAAEVVPGDLLIVEAGMRMVADARVVEEASLELDEAALTGEAYPVSKQPAALPDPQAPLSDRTNMLYSGTVVTRGRGRAVVVGTGMETELGKIAALLEETGETTTPLQRRLHRVGQVLIVIAAAICALVMVAGLLRRHSLQEMFLTAVSLAVAAVPEGLPAVITIALALGAQQMVRRQALIRRLPAVETLGSVTVICTDKTGTLTEGAMRPARLWTAEGEGGPGGPPHAEELLQALVLCNDAHLPITEAGEPDWERATGDPTEVALLAAGLAAGLRREALEKQFPRLEEIPFDSDRKRMTTIHPRPEGAPTPYFAMVKGAPDLVLARSDRVRVGGEKRPLDDETRARIAAQIRELSGEGLRVLAAAYAPLVEIPGEPDPEVIERDLVFLGLIALQDPPRPEAAPAVARAREAGIRTVMVTGDYAATAAAIAEQVGLRRPDGRVMEGPELAALSVEELAERVEHVDVYARVSPEDKVKVVEAWRRRGESVAVTGDGVNDAAALQRAEIGVAMGRTGTQVTKDAADMVLLDDSFATIVAAVEQGRVIYDNVRKFIRYLLGTNTGEIWTIFGSIVLGWPLPLLPVQILFVNLVTDGLPALALGFEPAEGDVMRRPPRPPQESLFARGMGYNIVWTGLLMALLTLALYWWDWQRGGDLTHARTLAFFTLAGLQMANVLSVRLERALVWGRNFFTNPRLLAAVALTLALQLAVTYVPLLQRVLKTSALTGAELGLGLGACAAFFLVSEGANWLEIRAARQRESRAARGE
jgi:Ca2+-transporting ATPase